MKETIRPGYKETEIGIFPDSWEILCLGSIVKDQAPIRYGVVQIGPDVADGVPIIPIKYLKQITTSTLHRSSREIEGRYTGSRVTGSDVLISVKGTIGRIGIVPDGFEGNIAREIARIRLRSGFEPYFVASQLESRQTQRRISETVVGTTRLEFSIAAVRDFKIAVPSNRAEQRAIAEALSDADAWIEGLEQLIAKKRQIKHGAMQALLTGKTRLPGFSGEWEVKRLRNDATLKARIGWQGLTTAEYLDSGDFFLVTGTEFADGRINWADCHYVEGDRYMQDSYIQLREKDVLVTKDGTIGKIAVVQELRKPATLNSGVFVVRPRNNSFDPVFLYHVMSSNIFTDFLVRLSAGSTINHLYQKDFVDFSFDAPPSMQEQTSIAEILSDMDAGIAALKAKAVKARAIKQGMMQDLLTGKVRLI